MTLATDRWTECESDALRRPYREDRLTNAETRAGCARLSGLTTREAGERRTKSRSPTSKWDCLLAVNRDRHTDAQLNNHTYVNKLSDRDPHEQRTYRPIGVRPSVRTHTAHNGTDRSFGATAEFHTKNTYNVTTRRARLAQPTPPQQNHWHLNNATTAIKLFHSRPPSI